MKTRGVGSLADLEWLGEPDRASLRRAIRHRLRHFDPTLRVVAEGFLAEQSEIDLLAVGNEGDLVSIRIGHQGGDAVLLTQSLSDLTWLRPRREHLLKLSPGLGLEPSAEPRGILVSPDFAPETCSAAENLPTRTIQRLSYRCLRLQGQLSVLLTDEAHPRRAEPPVAAAPHAESPPRAAHAEAPGAARLTAPPSPSSFRTGLSDADLGRRTPLGSENSDFPDGENDAEGWLS